MTVVSIHQPAYLPWLGYMDKVLKSGTFVYLDTVQIGKNSFSYRNKIKTPQGSTWLTVPLKMKGHMSNVIKDVRIDNSQQWRKKHLKNIFFNYKKSTFFDELYPKLEQLYAKRYDFFSDMVFEHTVFWFNELDIQTKLIKSSDLNIDSKKSDLILDLCIELNASKYISGEMGKNYLEEGSFKKCKIEVEYQNYSHPVYNQLHGDFLPNMCIVDFWMNTHNKQLITGIKDLNI